MKRLLLTTAIAAASLTATADGTYGYLTFASADGHERSVPTDGLVITFDGDNLVATQGGTTTTIALADLASMRFAASASAISTLRTADAPVAAYTPNGMLVGRYESLRAAQQELPRGIYIIMSNGTSQKIAVQ